MGVNAICCPVTAAQMTSTATLTSFIISKINDASDSSYCLFTAAVNNYRETALLLRTAGHNTSELDSAVIQYMESVDKLRAARNTAVNKFKQEGLKYSIVETTQRIDTEADSLT